MVVTVERIGGSLAVVIPAPIVSESRLTEGAALDVRVTPAGILFRPQNRRPRRSMAALVKKIAPLAYARHRTEMVADTPVGREHW